MGEPQILEPFKNTLPSKSCWILFSINNLRDVVDATKKVLTKEKIVILPHNYLCTTIIIHNVK